MNKLEYLAIVNAWPNQIDGWNYFKYYKMDIYKLNNFDKFIDLIENGTIKMTIKVDIYISEKYYGKTYNHGCGFCIEEKNLCELFSIIK